MAGQFTPLKRFISVGPALAVLVSGVGALAGQFTPLKRFISVGPALAVLVSGVGALASQFAIFLGDVVEHEITVALFGRYASLTRTTEGV